MAFDLDEDELKATRKMNKADRNEIEVGEYIRTKDGIIDKVIIEYDGKCNNPNCSEKHISCKYNYYNEKEIVKHSKQIIDLVEVGDYVNGREVKHIAMFEGFPDYPKLIFVDETHLIPDDTCENDEIKTILTKEQFEANCYRVGGRE